MKSGQIIVTAHVKPVVTLVNERGKNLPVPWLRDKASQIGSGTHEVQYLEEQGQVYEIRVGDQTYLKDTMSSPPQTPKKSQIHPPRDNRSSNRPRDESRHGHNISSSPASRARAPYNFVDLPKEVIEFPKPIPSQGSYDTDLFTGYIELNIKCEQPVFVRGGRDPELAKDKDKAQKLQNYSVDGFAAIPGSTIRGMLRSAYEVITHSSPVDFIDNSQFFHRNFAATTKLPSKDQYNDIFDSKTGRYLAKGGFLVKSESGNGHQIIEARAVFRVDKSSLPEDTQVFKVCKIYFDEQPDTKDHKHSRGSLEYAKLGHVSKEAGKYSGALVVSGYINRKHLHWVLQYPDEQRNVYSVSNEVKSLYESDVNRRASRKKGNHDDFGKLFDRLNSGRDCIKLPAKEPGNEIDAVPCFFLIDKKKDVTVLGHTGIFRLPYKHNVHDFIPEHLKVQKMDFAKALFGFVSDKEIDFDDKKFKALASRLKVEDAVSKKKLSEVVEKEHQIKVLGSPKPTCVQHYLKQENGQCTADWSSNPKTTEIRGTKRYWHHSDNADWKMNTNENNASAELSVTIRPVRTGTEFVGRLYFENLYKFELGLLLATIHGFDGDWIHKVGMGKPYGLGSVTLKPSLYLFDVKNSYSSLNNAFELPKQSQNIQDFVSSAEIEFTSGEVNLRSGNSVRQLHRLMTVKKKRHEVEYMMIQKPNGKKKNGKPDSENEYKGRPVLGAVE